MPLAAADQRAPAPPPPRRLQHERERHRRPLDRHGRRSAEHPLRRRDGDQQGGQRLHRSPGAVGSRRRRRIRRRRAVDDVHRRPDARSSGRWRGWSGRGGPAAPSTSGTTSRWSRRRRSTRAIAAMLESVQIRECVTGRQLAQPAGDLPQPGRDRGAVAGLRRQPRRRRDDPDAARPVRRACARSTRRKR